MTNNLFISLCIKISIQFIKNYVTLNLKLLNYFQQINIVCRVQDSVSMSIQDYFNKFFLKHRVAKLLNSCVKYENPYIV